MEPTPTEAEMREAIAYAVRNATESSSFPIACDAYAAARAKCRGDAEKIRADERERWLEILRKYGRHSDRCNQRMTTAMANAGSAIICCCGLDAAIRGGQ